MTVLHSFLTGASTLACAVVALFFARFWRETGERLFALFAIAFFALSVNRALVVFPFAREAQPSVYLIRLLAFLIIAYAVVDRNRR